MKKTIGCFVQLMLLLALAALLAVPMACVATATAPMHSPQIAEKFLCAPNTHMNAEWYQASWNHPGEKTLSVICVDAEGNETPTLPQDEKSLLTGVRTYFPYLFLPLLVISAIMFAGLNFLGVAIGTFWKKLKQDKENKNERPTVDEIF